MDNNGFYDVIDAEIKTIINENKDKDVFKGKKEEGKKSFGFLLWFLENTLHKGKKYDQYSQYIVDGNDDNSCDMIFLNKEHGEDVYYVVQSKWFAKSNINKTNDITSIYKACLTDFYMILDHKKAESSTNMKFNKMYRKLKKHTDNNGKVRFILVALCVTNPDVRLQELHEYRNTSLVSTKIYDLTILKNMYIDKKFRGYITHNPLEETESVNQMIDINLKKKGSLQNGNDTYIFLLGAEEISRLYKLFGDRLFLKNVRNPLGVLIYFWYIHMYFVIV